MSAGKAIDIEEQYDKIYRYCYFKLRSRETAEDITQETFLRCYERYGHYGNEWTLQYLYRIAHNLCIDEYRKKKPVQIPEELPDKSYEEEILTRVWIKDALSELAEEEKELLLLRYVNEVPVGVIVTVFGMSKFAYYRKVKKALQKLQNKLGVSHNEN